MNVGPLHFLTVLWPCPCRKSTLPPYFSLNRLSLFPRDGSVFSLGLGPKACLFGGREVQLRLMALAHIVWPWASHLASEPVSTSVKWARRWEPRGGGCAQRGHSFLVPSAVVHGGNSVTIYNSFLFMTQRNSQFLLSCPSQPSLQRNLLVQNLPIILFWHFSVCHLGFWILEAEARSFALDHPLGIPPASCKWGSLRFSDRSL